MKKVVKPASAEIASYYSDFSGRVFINQPECKLAMNFLDHTSFELHLTEQEALEVISSIALKCTDDFRKECQHRIQSLERDYSVALDSRDWTECEYLANNIEKLKILGNIKKD